MAQNSTSRYLVLGPLPEGTSSVDVFFDEMRVWSIDVRDIATGADVVEVEWPDQLLPHLTGHTTIRVVDSASGREFRHFDAEFDSSPARTAVVNDGGIPLVVNKWGRLAPDLSALGRKTRRRLVRRSATLIDELQSLGLRPFVVGGTLLGGVREGTLLPHDDDADIAYLSKFTHPADVAREGFRIGHELQRRGYEIQRHSAAHMQLIFRRKKGAVEHYIDIFTAFFSDDGCINQPFHVRDKMRHDQMLPFSTVTIDGTDFPAPADVDHWLTINYDENWRQPIPGFQLLTPEGTRRRFDGWFGGFNFQREFWDQLHETGEHSQAEAAWAPGAEWVALQDLSSSTLLDIGSGAGQTAQRLRQVTSGSRIISCDYSRPARRVSEARFAGTNIETAHLNLYRLLSLSLPARLSVEGSFDLVANHVLDQIGHLGRANALRLIRMALRSGGNAYATCFGVPAPNADESDPTTWHLGRYDLRREAALLGLRSEFTTIEAAPSLEERRPYGVRFTLDPRASAGRNTTMMQRLKRALRRASSSDTAELIRSLQARVDELELELAELRHDSLRVAELIDLAEETLSARSTTNSADEASGQGSA